MQLPWWAGLDVEHGLEWQGWPPWLADVVTVSHCMYFSLPGCIQQGSGEHLESWNWSGEEVLHTMSCSTMRASSDSHARPCPTLLIAVVQ